MAEDFNYFVQIPAEVSGTPDEYCETIEIDGAPYVSEFFSNRRDNGMPMKGPTAFWFEPILPQRSLSRSIALNPDVLELRRDVPVLRWRIYADNSQERREEIDFSKIPIVNTKDSAV